MLYFIENVTIEHYLIKATSIHMTFIKRFYSFDSQAIDFPSTHFTWELSKRKENILKFEIFYVNFQRNKESETYNSPGSYILIEELTWIK